MTFNDILLKADFDQTLTSADNIELFTPNTGSPQQFYGSRAGMTYFALTGREFSEGQERIDPTTAADYVGFRQVRYTQPAMHPDAYEWLVANYRGQVTVSLPLDGTQQSTWNAWLRFTKTPSSTKRGWYQVVWVFTLTEATI
jgi:hypothetical protein